MSNVRVDIPTSGIASTDDVRQNFAVIKQELEVLQSFMGSAKLSDSPIITGTAQMNNAVMSGSLSVAGSFLPQAESYLTTWSATYTPGGNISSLGYDLTLGPLKLCKNALGEVVIAGSVNATYSGGGSGQLVAIGGVPPAFLPIGQAITIPVSQYNSTNVFALFITPLGQINLINPSGAASYLITFSGVYRPIP